MAKRNQEAQGRGRAAGPHDSGERDDSSCKTPRRM